MTVQLERVRNSVSHRSHSVARPVRPKVSVPSNEPGDERFPFVLLRLDARRRRISELGTFSRFLSMTAFMAEWRDRRPSSHLLDG